MGALFSLMARPLPMRFLRSISLIAEEPHVLFDLIVAWPPIVEEQARILAMLTGFSLLLPRIF